MLVIAGPGNKRVVRRFVKRWMFVRIKAVVVSIVRRLKNMPLLYVQTQQRLVAMVSTTIRALVVEVEEQIIHLFLTQVATGSRTFALLPPSGGAIYEKQINQRKSVCEQYAVDRDCRLCIGVVFSSGV